MGGARGALLVVVEVSYVNEHRNRRKIHRCKFALKRVQLKNVKK